MQVYQTNKFKKAYKKLHSNQRAAVNNVLQEIISNPALGEQKKGDLAWLRVYKCTLIHQPILIGYSVDDNALILTFVAFGAHENFYRDLKK